MKMDIQMRPESAHSGGSYGNKTWYKAFTTEGISDFRIMR